MVAVASVGSPACFILPCPLLLLVPIGLIGLLVCLVGLFHPPRWCGAIGLLVGVACFSCWVGFFWLALSPALAQMRLYNLTVLEYTTLLMRSQAVAQDVETRRARSGSLPQSLASAGVSAENLVDPWNRPFRYSVDPEAPRGYRRITDGKDGVPDTADDIDLIAIERYGFSIP